MDHKTLRNALALHAFFFLATMAIGQAGSGAHMTIADVKGKDLVCDLGTVAYDVRIVSDSTFHWKDKSGHEETNPLTLVDVDAHTALLGWDENDSTFVSMVINVMHGTAHVVYLTRDREMGFFSGTLRVKE